VKGWLRISAFAAVACLLTGGLALAQSTSSDDSQQQEDQRRPDHNSIAVGVGLVNTDSQTQPYLMAALRLRIGGHHQQDSGDWRGRPPDTGIRGYFEPEVGYWKQKSSDGGGKDELLGFNLIGVIPLGPVDSFFGAGAAYHRIDNSILLNGPATGSQGKLGVDAQFGIDIYLTRSVSLFGAGRFDLVQDLHRGVEGKAYLGLRARF